MSTRKIRLSQTLTLSFRDISTLPGAYGNVAASMNQETDQGSSGETFDSLPDLLPYIFLSQEKPSAPGLPYLVTDCSTYKLWESCTTDVNPLASQIEEAEHWLLTGTHTSGADNFQADDSDSIPSPTRIGVSENLRRVQAFSPHTSTLYVEQADVSRSEDLQSAHADVTCDAGVEVESQPDSLDIPGDTNGSTCVDRYLILDEDMAKVDSPLEESKAADATCDAAIEFERRPDALDIGGYTDGISADCYLILDGDMTKEDSPSDESTVADEAVNSILPSISAVSDGQVEDVDSVVKKRTKSLKSPYQESNYSDSLDFPKQFRKQKRSRAPRRREGPSASIDLVHKTNWLSDTGTKQDHLEPDQCAQVPVHLPSKKEKSTSHTRKIRRKTVSISSVRKLFTEPPANQSVKLQPSGRQGKKKKPLRSDANLNSEE